MDALAYHLIWSTYGTWLPGDSRGWIKPNYQGVQEPDPKLEQDARSLMAEAEVVMSPAQRVLIELTIQDHCRIRNWQLHAFNVRTNHIHVVVTADRDAVEVRNQLKAWCSRRLSDECGLKKAVAVKAGRRRWFTEGGEQKRIENEEYLQNAIRYAIEGQ